MEIKISESQAKPRIEAKIKIAIRGKYGIFETYVGNISQSGIFLEASKPIAKIGEKVDLIINLLNSKESVKVIGKVIRIVGPNQLGKTRGIGIEFLKIEAKHTFLFSRFLEELLNARGMGCRKSPRINARITVQFANPIEMGKCLTNNLSRGGIFIQTKEEFTLGQNVSIVLIHPVTSETIEIEGEIVHVRKGLASQTKLNLNNGIGVQFINLSNVKEAKINRFLRNLLIQKKKRRPRKSTES